MTSILYTAWTSVMNLNVGAGAGYDVTAENAEKILDLAIDALNLFGNLEMSNMAGTAGSKTVNLNSGQKAAVFIVARAIFYGFYKELDTSNVGGVNMTTSDLMKDPETIKLIKDCAEKLNAAEQDDDYTERKVLVG
jgi:hypothetical protein